MPLYDCKCPMCGFNKSDILLKRDEAGPYCEVCLIVGLKMRIQRRTVQKSNFALKGDCWEKDGYSSSKKEKT